MARYRITISSPSRSAMLDLVRTHRIPVSDHGVRHSDREGYMVDAIVDESAIPTLEAAGYGVQRHEDVDEAGQERQAEVGRGNRFLKPPP